VGSERPYPATPDTATRIAAPVTKYYYANGQRACPEQSRRVATRVDDALYYVYSDLPSTSLRASLGSTVAVSDGDGGEVGRVGDWASLQRPPRFPWHARLRLPVSLLCHDMPESAFETSEV
jgi:hypothetical protein